MRLESGFHTTLSMVIEKYWVKTKTSQKLEAKSIDKHQS